MSTHRDAVAAFEQGRIKDGLRALDGLLAEEESAELWNDWAVMQLAAGQSDAAESGFRRALALDANYLDAATNLGLLLLDKGDRQQAAILLERALPSLPAQQQELVRRLLKEHIQEEENAPAGDVAVIAPLEILVISDAFPHFKTNSSELRLMQIVQALREQGRRVTFVARDGINSKTYEPQLQEMGVQTFRNDGERLACLGNPDIASSWSIGEILAASRFSVAILALSFSRGISVPEHYLDDIRRYSPKTRIAILADRLHDEPVNPHSQQADLAEQEIAHDWTRREFEIFERADLVIVARESDADRLRSRGLKSEITVVAQACRALAAAAPFQSRCGILYAANFDQPGNRDGFVWFMEGVWPKVAAKARKIALIVAGENVPVELQRKWLRVNWKSSRDFVELLAATRIFVSPQIAAGSSGALLTMLAGGLPGVTTSTAAETAGVPSFSGLLTADSPDSFAEAVLQIYENAGFWNELQGRGSALIAAHYSPVAVAFQLAYALDRLGSLPAKPLSPEPCSMLLIESLFSQRLSLMRGDQRVLGQLECYVRLAEQMLREKKPERALEQLRHIFGRRSGSRAGSQFFAQVFALLKRAYRELEDIKMADRCAAQARGCMSGTAGSGAARTAAAKRSTSERRLFSLIVPTFNRLPILKKCLSALEAQSLPAKDFEVIVIDDGSSDGTEDALRQYRPQFHFKYLRQTNSGTGAARRNGVAHATGDYLLLMNDDTICDADLLEQHLYAQREFGSHDWAVLGNFEYPVEARHRALTHYFCVEPFMFPQVSMEEACPYGYSHFITCNLSIRREALIQAGSFDSTYKLSEDTELGIRLFERGHRVLYHPAAHAWHDHLPYPARNLIRRARVYGADYFHMFRAHPRVLREWALPVKLTAMDERNALLLVAYVEEHRNEVERAVEALERWDAVEFEPFLAEQGEIAATVVNLFRQAVPAVHWFYLFESMLQTMIRELKLVHLGAQSQPAHAAAGD